MLTITLGAVDSFDDETGKFVKFGGFPVRMEHSLVSISKWEESHEKSFISDEKSDQDMLDYIGCMILPGNYPDDILNLLTQENVTEITAYINAKRSGTTFADAAGNERKTERITSEQVYSWMAAHHIDWSCENWHITRLLNLIRICNINASQDPKKKSRPVTGKSALSARRAMNQARREQMGSTG